MARLFRWRVGKRTGTSGNPSNQSKVVRDTICKTGVSTENLLIVNAAELRTMTAAPYQQFTNLAGTPLWVGVCAVLYKKLR